jgi:hypothetical protein
MFGFRRRRAPRPLTDAIRRAIENDGMMPSVSNPAQLQMVESAGRYSDRKVTYFRIFDPASAAHSVLALGRYQDYGVFTSRVLRSGHVERDGTVVIVRPAPVLAAEPSMSAHAERRLHADDARVVRGETDVSSRPDEGGLSGSV